MTDATDLTVIRYGVDLLNLDAWGIPVKVLLDLVLLFLVLFGVTTRTYKGARYALAAALRVLRGPSPAAAVDGAAGATDEPDEVAYPAVASPALKEIFNALCLTGDASYDPETHVLKAGGLSVTFESNRETAIARDLRGAAGEDLAAILSTEELELARDHAIHLRNHVRKRDLDRANLAAARALYKARQDAAFVLRMDDGDQGDGPEPAPPVLSYPRVEFPPGKVPLHMKPKKVPVIPARSDKGAK